jgi:hypothetical protein
MCGDQRRNGVAAFATRHEIGRVGSIMREKGERFRRKMK